MLDRTAMPLMIQKVAGFNVWSARMENVHVTIGSVSVAWPC